MPLKHFVCAALIAWFASTCFAQGTTGLPERFVVQLDTPRSSEVVRFLCKFGEAGSIRCDLSQISVNYYEWSDKSPETPEPKRCHITSGTWTSQVYEPVKLGRWRRTESGLCGASIETELIAEGGQVSMREKTVANPGFKPDDLGCRSYGPAGTVKVYKPVVESLPVPRACSSVVIDPY